MKAKDHRANLLLNRTTASGQHQPVDVPNSGTNIRLETIRPLPEASTSADGSSPSRNELGQPRSSSLWRPSSMGIFNTTFSSIELVEKNHYISLNR